MKEERIITCPNCGNRTPHVIISKTAVEETLETIDSISFEVDHFEVESYFFVTRCGVCNQSAAFTTCDVDEFPDNLNDAIQIWPQQNEIHPGVPKSINETYLQAKRVRKISSVAYGVLIRRTVEEMCNHQGAAGYSLKDKISDLAKRNIIPIALADMANLIRVIGNMSAHGASIELSKAIMNEVDDYVLTLIEFVYVLPQRMDRLGKKLKI